MFLHAQFDRCVHNFAICMPSLISACEVKSMQAQPELRMRSLTCEYTVLPLFAQFDICMSSLVCACEVESMHAQFVQLQVGCPTSYFHVNYDEDVQCKYMFRF